MHLISLTTLAMLTSELLDKVTMALFSDIYNNSGMQRQSSSKISTLMSMKAASRLKVQFGHIHMYGSKASAMEQQPLIEGNQPDMLTLIFASPSKSSIYFELNSVRCMDHLYLLTSCLFVSSNAGVFLFSCRRHKTNFSLRASDLGVESWYAEDLGDLKVVPLECLTGHLILAPITVRERDIWITVQYDHVRVWSYLLLSILKQDLQEKAEVDLDATE